MTFLGMAYLRVRWTSYSNHTPMPEPWLFDTAVWTFVAVSLFFLAVLMVIEGYSPTKADRVAKEKRDALVEEVKKNLKRIDELAALNSEERARLHAKRQETHRLLMRMKGVEDQIKGWHAEAVAEYKRENAIKRQDGLTPDCFDQPVPPLVGRLDTITL